MPMTDPHEVEALLEDERELETGKWEAQYIDNNSWKVVRGPHVDVSTFPSGFEAGFAADARNLLPQIAGEWLQMRAVLQKIAEGLDPVEAQRLAMSVLGMDGNQTER